MKAIKKFLKSRKDSTFFFAYLVVAITIFLNGILVFYLPIHLDNLGFTGFQIGLLFAVSVITGLLFIFHIGIFIDRISPRRMSALGLLLIGIYLLGFSFTSLFSIILFLFFLSGFGYNVFMLTMDSFTLKKVRNSIGKRFGVYSAIRNIPFGIGMLIGGYLLFLLDFNLLLKITGIITLLIISLVCFIPDTKKSFESVGAYLKDFLNLRVILFSLLLFIFTLHWGVELVAYGLFLKENLKLNFIQMGWYMSMPLFFLGFTAIFLGKRFDRGLSAKKLLLISFLLSGFGFALMAMTTNPFISFFFRIIHDIGDGAFAVFVFTGVASYFTKCRMGGNYGLITLMTIIGRFIGALIFSPIGSAYGYQWPHIICGSIIVVAGLFILLFKK